MEKLKQIAWTNYKSIMRKYKDLYQLYLAAGKFTVIYCTKGRKNVDARGARTLFKCRNRMENILDRMIPLSAVHFVTNTLTIKPWDLISVKCLKQMCRFKGST